MLGHNFLHMVQQKFLLMHHFQIFFFLSNKLQIQYQLHAVHLNVNGVLGTDVLSQ